jgi:phosphoribosylamine---glycine ligase
MKVLVVGSGAREHAIALACARSADVVVVPGRDAMAARLENGHAIERLSAPPEEIEADLVVIGPEEPLVDGLADRLRAKGRVVLGPGQEGARLEASKAYMKELCAAANVPTAAFAAFDRLDDAIDHLRKSPGPYVIKTDGLAGGKGVFVTDELSAAEHDVQQKLYGVAFGDAGRRIVIEEALSGTEFSLQVLCDGQRAVPLPLARDYKRVGEGDTGPNTGGMGAFSPVPQVREAVVSETMDRIVEPVLGELFRRGADYRGVLYAGLMLTDDGVKLLEFNVRLGDPEAEVVLPRIEGDVAELLLATANGGVPDRVPTSSDAAVCVVIAAPGYPLTPRTGDVVEGLREAAAVKGVTVLHAGTDGGPDGIVRSAAGRVVAVTGVASTLETARERAYEAASRIDLNGAVYRLDIATDAMPADGTKA